MWVPSCRAVFPRRHFLIWPVLPDREAGVAAALGVFGSGSAWPDLLVAAVMATLALTAAWSVMRQASAELRARAW